MPIANLPCGAWIQTQPDTHFFPWVPWVLTYCLSEEGQVLHQGPISST